MGDSSFKRILRPYAEFEANNAKRQVGMSVKGRGEPYDGWAAEDEYSKAMARHGFNETWNPPVNDETIGRFNTKDAEYEAKNAKRQAEMMVHMRGGESYEAYDLTMIKYGYYKTWE